MVLRYIYIYIHIIQTKVFDGKLGAEGEDTIGFHESNWRSIFLRKALRLKIARADDWGRLPAIAKLRRDYTAPCRAFARPASGLAGEAVGEGCGEANAEALRHVVVCF